MKRYSSHAELEIERLRDGTWQRASDCIAIEEPLEIRLSRVVGGRREKSAIGITMRTPGNDFELAAGFLFGEGIVSRREDIEGIEYCDDVIAEADQQNTVLVTLRDGLEVNLEDQRRNFAITSACGVCGKASLAALAMDGCETLHSGASITAGTLMSLPKVLRAAQEGFEATGGVHAAGLFTNEGELVALGEDVGRHNAFDKLIGRRFLAGVIAEVQDMTVVLSGRASYELLQKSLRARIPIVAAVGAPSSLAVEIATNFGMTLVGFVKPTGFNVYAGRERIRE